MTPRRPGLESKRWCCIYSLHGDTVSLPFVLMLMSPPQGRMRHSDCGPLQFNVQAPLPSQNISSLADVASCARVFCFSIAPMIISRQDVLLIFPPFRLVPVCLSWETNVSHRCVCDF